MSSDINYLGLYLRSIRKNSEKMPEIAWHLHVVIDRTYEEGFIEKLQNENKNIYFSFEFHSSLQPKAYYTMARFLYAEKEIENLQAPIIITDIDSILKSEDKLREILSINTADFGFKIAPYYHHFPWHKIQASATALYSKPKAKALLFQMKVWFSENYLEAHPNQWWIDQVALYEAFSNLTEKSSYIDIFKDVNLAFEFAKATPAAKAEMASKIAH